MKQFKYNIVTRGSTVIAEVYHEVESGTVLSPEPLQIQDCHKSFGRIFFSGFAPSEKQLKKAKAWAINQVIIMNKNQ